MSEIRISGNCCTAEEKAASVATADDGIMATLLRPALRRIGHIDRVVLVLVVAVGVYAIHDPARAWESIVFVARNFLSLMPFILLSIGVAAYMNATGADNLVARAFRGRPLSMIFLAAAMGALSPFCSCGVIPLIAGLLAMGVPLPAVMAFWLASPLMDPSMFVITIGALGIEFAIAKLLVAFSVGLMGGLTVYVVQRAGGLKDILRPGVGGGCSSGCRPKNAGVVQWRFWREAPRRHIFRQSVLENIFFLGKWLALAFFIESLMQVYLPGEEVVKFVGGGDAGSILLAAALGVPAYLNGYAALPLVGGLIEQGMAPGAGMAFLIGGGVTSIPAAMAVWALARLPVFFTYLALSLTGAFLAGFAFQAWSVV